VAMAPYLFRLSALSMSGMWQDGRYPRLERWYAAMSARDSFRSAVVDWVPPELGAEMLHNGQLSWPKVAAILQR
jgi:glutathione S-transferase